MLFAWICVFNASDTWLVPIGSASDEASLRLPRLFFPYINSTSSSFFTISTLLSVWKETVAQLSPDFLPLAHMSLSLEPSRGPSYR